MADIVPTPTPTPTPNHELRKRKGRALARLDREQKMRDSGPLGAERLIVNIAIDYMERHPNMTWDEAVFAARAYCDRAHG